MVNGAIVFLLLELFRETHAARTSLVVHLSAVISVNSDPRGGS